MAHRILVLGATGTVGSELVRRLVERGVRVRAATRRPERSTRQVGVEYVEFDFERPTTFGAALEGVERVFLMARPGDEQADRAAVPLIAAMQQQRIKHVVNLTAFGVDRLTDTALYRVERALEASGLSYAHLRPNWFMQIFATAPLLGALRATGKLQVPADDGKISFIDVRDLAEVAREALLDLRYAGRGFTLTGSAALDHSEVAEILSRAAGRAISYQGLGEDDTRAMLARAGLSRERIDRLLGFYRLVRQGLCAPVSQDVADVLGRPARSMAEFARDYAAAWRE